MGLVIFNNFLNSNGGETNNNKKMSPHADVAFSESFKPSAIAINKTSIKKFISGNVNNNSGIGKS